MQIVLGEKTGKLAILKIGDNITLELWYEAKHPADLPDQRIPIYPEELDKLCEWWAKAK